MRDRIRLAAEANSRSMNSEIVATLQRAYPDPSTTLDLMTFVARWMREFGSDADPGSLFYADYLKMAADAYFRQKGEDSGDGARPSNP